MGTDCHTKGRDFATFSIPSTTAFHLLNNYSFEVTRKSVLVQLVGCLFAVTYCTLNSLADYHKLSLTAHGGTCIG